MKKLSVFLVAIISLSVAFTSCKKDDPEQSKWFIDAKVENGATYNASIDSVYAEYSVRDGVEILGKAKYENGEFKMNLADPNPAHLQPIEVDEGVKVSDPTLKIQGLRDFSAIKAGEYAGRFIQSNMTLDDFLSGKGGGDGVGVTLYIYADKNATLSGEESYTHGANKEITHKTIYNNVSLKKGWNIMTGKLVKNTPTLTEVEIVVLSNTNGYKWYYIPAED